MRTARLLGARVIGASSVQPLPLLDEADECISLPFISDDGFDNALRHVLRTYGVTRLVTMHTGVWAHLARLARRDALVREVFCGPHPVQRQQEDFADSHAWAQRQAADDLAPSLGTPTRDVAPPLPVPVYASLHRGFLRTYGQCDVAKLEALCAIARVTPRGDVVELGVFFGRSAYALGRLAHAYGIGPTVGVDAWGRTGTTDQGPAAAVLNTSQSAYDQDAVFEAFVALATEVPGMTYLRAEAVAAAALYREAVHAGRLSAPGLGDVALTGGVSLLHVDANHRYDQVRLDVDAWEPMVQPGGWIVIDDYLWAFGDGPRRVGDALLARGDFSRAFTWGDSLFLCKQER
jgi:hypothetical protein